MNINVISVMKSRVYFYPSASRGGYLNPYCPNYKEALARNYKVLDRDNKPTKMLSFAFLLYSFCADIYVINWLESVCFLRLSFLQYLFARLGLLVIRLRRKKIVWMFHNIHPHEGNNQYSKILQRILFKDSSLIISHSQEAAEYARQKTCRKVVYRCHPVKAMEWRPNMHVGHCDILIWGAILPYKGVAEFLKLLNDKGANFRVNVIGKCKNRELENKIKVECNERISFQNIHVGFSDLAGMIYNSNYVVFPYVGDCVSSSGALIDTIVMGGTVVGPNRGAFKDLADEGVCITFDSNAELLRILSEEYHLDHDKRKVFIENNSWEKFETFFEKMVD